MTTRDADDFASCFDSLQARLHHQPPPFAFSETVFQHLLLAVIAKDQHLLLTTADDDIPAVTKLAVNVLHNLFAFSVVKLRLRPPDALTPDAFLRLLFLEAPSHRQSHYRRSRTSSGGLGHALAHTYRRSNSYPAPSTTLSTEDDSSPVIPFNIPVPAEKLTGSVRSQKRRERLALDHVYSDPLPTVILPDKTDQREVPHVIVISGLESTSFEVQSQVLKVLHDRQIVLDGPEEKDKGTYNLPEGFFLVCVCSAGDGRERPGLHKNLLDRFSLSGHIDLHADDNQTSPTFMSASRDSDTTSKLPRPILSREELQALQDLATPSHARIHNRLSLYVSDLFAGVRHHPHLDGTLLTSRCHKDTMPILRAWRVLFGPIPVREDDAEDGSEDRMDVLDVTDEDVKKVFPKVVGHRLRVRDGPADQLLSSAAFGAIYSGEENPVWPMGRRTVAEIVREVINNV